MARTLLRLMMVCLATLALTPADASQRLAHVRLQLKWLHQFQFAGYYMAKEMGYYRDAGLDVTIAPAQPGQDSIRTVLSGEAEFGVGTTDLVLHRQAGEDVVVLAVIFQHSPLALMVPATDGSQTLHDLAGKKLMIEPGSAELLAYLNREGLPESRFKLMPHSFRVQDLLNGTADGMSVYVTDEPWDMRVLGRPFQLHYPRAGGIDFYGDNLFTTGNYLQQQPQRVRAFREASLKGWEYAMQHPRETAELIHRKYSQRHTVEQLLFEAEQMKPLLQAELVAIGHMYPGRWRHIANVYAEIGMMKPGLALEGFLYDAVPPPEDPRRYYLLTGAALLFAALLGTVAWYIHRSKLRLEVSRKRHLTVFNNAPMAYIVANKQQIIVDWNHAAEHIFGWKRSEARGRHMYDLLVPPSELALVKETLGATLDEGRATHSINRNVTKDGREILCEWQNALYYDDNGDVLGSLSLGMDITERRALEVRLQTAKERAEQLLADQRQFMAMISHEFRSPLAVIDSATQILELRGAPDCPPDQVVERIRRGVRRLTNFLDNCLTEDRLDTRGWELDLKDVPLTEFLPSVLEQARVSAPRHTLVLENEVEGAILHADPQLLRILLQNLLDNGVKYSAPGTNITLRGFIPYPGCLALSVRDQGIGIAPDDKERVLKKYYRGRNTGQVWGAGLGLSLVARIVALHCGELQLESEVGAGTEITVHIPLEGPSAQV